MRLNICSSVDLGHLLNFGVKVTKFKMPSTPLDIRQPKFFFFTAIPSTHKRLNALDVRHRDTKSTSLCGGRQSCIHDKKAGQLATGLFS